MVVLSSAGRLQLLTFVIFVKFFFLLLVSSLLSPALSLLRSLCAHGETDGDQDDETGGDKSGNFSIRKSPDRKTLFPRNSLLRELDFPFFSLF